MEDVKLPAWYRGGGATRVAEAELPDGYDPPSASLDPADAETAEEDA